MSLCQEHVPESKRLRLSFQVFHDRWVAPSVFALAQLRQVDVVCGDALFVDELLDLGILSDEYNGI